jgi:HigB_toxin, RelE-like toxic component of a toxin-antitoxin system
VNKFSSLNLHLYESSLDQEGNYRKLCGGKRAEQVVICYLAGCCAVCRLEGAARYFRNLWRWCLLGRGSNRVVFDIGGSNYRMICKYAFGEKQVHLFICWIGTHAEYDKLCAGREQYTVTNY